jgi:hypothetical protein
MKRSIGNHKDIYEYDGAFGCCNCKKTWGALPGNPVQPDECKISSTDRRILKLEKQKRTITAELSYLHDSKAYWNKK